MQSLSFRWPEAEVLARLIVDAQGARLGAVDELLGILRPSFVAFFERHLPSDLAEDLAQLSLLRISGAITRIDPQRADSYIATVARNLLRTTYRRRALDHERHGDIDVAELPVQGVSADARVEYEDLVRAVHRGCLARLRPGLREVALGLLQGQSAAEIAAELEVSPVTIRTRLMRAREILRAELSAYLDSSVTMRRSG